jgi:hypothetical protein
MNSSTDHKVIGQGISAQGIPYRVHESKDGSRYVSYDIDHHFEAREAKFWEDLVKTSNEDLEWSKSNSRSRPRRTKAKRLH